MMKKILIGLMAMMTVALFGQSAQKPNKVRLIGYRTYVEHPFSTNKQQFLKDVRYKMDDDVDNYIDTTLYDPMVIDSLFVMLNKAKKVSTMNHRADEVVLQARYLSPEDIFLWGDFSTLDHKLLLLLFRNEKPEMVWLSSTLMERDSCRYEMPEELLTFISRFSTAIGH